MNISDIPLHTDSDIVEFITKGETVGSGETQLIQPIKLSDLHHHLTIYRQFDRTASLKEFFQRPGSDRHNDAGLTNMQGIRDLDDSSPEIIPPVVTYKSLMDGFLSYGMNAIHYYELPMVYPIADFILSTFGGKIALSFGQGDARRWILGLDSKNEKKAKKVLNNFIKEYNDFIDKDIQNFIERAKQELKDINDLQTLKPNYFKTIKSKDDFYNFFHGNLDPNSNLSHSIFPANKMFKYHNILQLEGCHMLNMNKYSINNIVIGKNNSGDIFFNTFTETNTEKYTTYKIFYDSGNPLYGGFIKNDINLSDNNNISKQKAFIDELITDGLICVTLHHGFWNGLGGAATYLPRGNAVSFKPKAVEFPARFSPNLFPDSYLDIIMNLGFKHYKNTHLTEFGRQIVKYLFKNGLVVDLKHTHRNGRYQVLEMAKNGFDIDPVYNNYGNPCVDKTDGYLDYKKFRPNINDTQRPHIMTGKTNCIGQIMVSHAAFAFTSREFHPSDISSTDSNLLSRINSQINRAVLNKRAISEKKYKNKSNSKPFKIVIPQENAPFYNTEKQIEDYLIKEGYYEDSQGQSIESYIFYEDTMNIFDEEIWEIIKLKGTFAIISEDRNLRANLEGGKIAINASIEFCWPYNLSSTSEEYIYAEKVLSNIYIGLQNIYNENNNNYSTKSTDYDSLQELSKIYFDNNEAEPKTDFKSTKKFYNDHLSNKDMKNRLAFDISTNKLYPFDPDPKKMIKDKLFLAGMNAHYKHVEHLFHIALSYYLLNNYSNNTNDTISNKIKDNFSNNISNWNILNDLILKSFNHHTSASDFDGVTDPLNSWSSPRMTRIQFNYVYHRLKLLIYQIMYGKFSPITNLIEDYNYEHFINGEYHKISLIKKSGFSLNVTDLKAKISVLAWQCLKKMYHTNFYDQIKLAKNW